MNNLGVYIAIFCCFIAVVISIVAVISIIVTVKSKNKDAYKKVMVDDYCYQLLPIKNKDSNYVKLYKDSPISSADAPLIKENEDFKVADVSVEDNLKEINKDFKFKRNDKSRFVFHYFNINEPSLHVYYYEKGNLVKDKKYVLADFQMENGLVVNSDALARVISADFPYHAEIDLLLSIYDCFNHTTSLPKISYAKAHKLYVKDIKENYKNYKDNYISFVSEYKHKLGFVFNHYFIPIKYFDFFKKLALLLGSRLSTYDLFTNYLYRLLKTKYNGNYSLIYTNDYNVTILNVYQNKLTSAHDFYALSVDEALSQFLLISAKHEFEFEKHVLSNVLVSSKSFLDFKSRIGLDLTEVNIDFSSYLGGGTKV